ncbi:MAG: hypothetical protein ACE5SW_09665 [Nitrososphaeraceae archaeon]
MKILLFILFFAISIGAFILIHFTGGLIFLQVKNQSGLDDKQVMNFSLGKNDLHRNIQFPAISKG